MTYYRRSVILWLQLGMQVIGNNHNGPKWLGYQLRTVTSFAQAERVKSVFN